MLLYVSGPLVEGVPNSEYGDELRQEDYPVVEFLNRWEDIITNKRDDVLYLKDWHMYRTYPNTFYQCPHYFESDWLNTYWDDNMGGVNDYRFCYMGTKGSWTALHRDVFASYSWSYNVCGRKLWILFPPCEEHKLLDKWKRNMVTDVYWGDVDSDVYPLYDSVKYRMEVMQEAGECIFVPSSWFHQVINIDHTISINHNWFNVYNIEIVHEYIMKQLLLTRNEIRHLRKSGDIGVYEAGWEKDCQLILKANIGIDMHGWISLLSQHIHDSKKVVDILMFIMTDVYVTNDNEGETYNRLRDLLTNI